MAINFITGNQNKFDEINLIVGNLEKLHIDLVEIQSLDAHLIIRSKLQEAFKHHPGPFIVEDTSLYLEGINGLPGPLIKWFLDTLKPDGIADLVEKIGNNRATAMTIIGYAEHQDNIQFFEGKLNGQIVRPRGSLDFGWGLLFNLMDNRTLLVKC